MGMFPYRKRTGAFYFLLLLITMGLTLYGCRSSEGPDRMRKRVVLDVCPVREMVFVDKIKVSGNLKSNSQVACLPKAPGKLIGYVVEEGQAVKKGDVIAELDRDVTGFKYQPLLVTSDIDGVVLELPLDVGEYVSPSTPVAYIGSQGDMELMVYVSEADVHRVKEGDEVLVYIPGANSPLSAKVAVVSRRIDPRFHNARVRIFIKDGASDLLPGMFARAEIIIGRHNGIAIPREAIIRPAGTNVDYAFVVNNGRVEKRILRLGRLNGDFQEILSGLKKGDLVVISGQGKVKEGDEVETRNSCVD